MTAMHNPFFDLKFVVTLALAILGHGRRLHLSRPEASLRGWAWLLLIPVGLLGHRNRRRDDDAAAAADDDAAGRQQFADLPDRHSAAVAAAAGGGADRLAPRRAERGPRLPALSPDCCRRDWRRRCTPRTAPTIHRCSWRPGTASRPRWLPLSVRWRDRGCCGFRAAPLVRLPSWWRAPGRGQGRQLHIAGAAVCCMRWKRSTCCAVEGRSRS